MSGERLTDDAVAMRVAREFREGEVVNLGAGMGLRCANFVPPDRDVILHAENGILGFGEIITDHEGADPDLSFGFLAFSRKPGMAFVDHTESFAIIRGGHIDLTVLGAMQVSERGDLANNTLPGKTYPSYGGAPDLAYNAKRVVVYMSHTTKDGQPKIVTECTLPLTCPQCVDLIVTDLAVIEVTPDGLVLKEVAPGWSAGEIQALTGAPLTVSEDLKEIDLT
jgi:3-oxoacid CoA-transferase subunit B